MDGPLECRFFISTWAFGRAHVETHFKNLGFLGFLKKPKNPEKLGF